MSKALIVDDEPDICEILNDYLVLKGFETEIIHSGEEALEILSTGLPDLMVLDVNMPGISGIGVLREMKKRSYQVAVFVLTGLRDIDTAKEAMACGALDFLVKPVDVTLFSSSIDFVMKKQMLIQKIPDQQGP